MLSAWQLLARRRGRPGSCGAARCHSAEQPQRSAGQLGRDDRRGSRRCMHGGPVPGKPRGKPAEHGAQACGAPSRVASSKKPPSPTRPPAPCATWARPRIVLLDRSVGPQSSLRPIENGGVAALPPAVPARRRPHREHAGRHRGRRAMKRCRFRSPAGSVLIRGPSLQDKRGKITAKGGAADRMPPPRGRWHPTGRAPEPATFSGSADRRR